jgi:hypothetical protein
MELNWNEMEEIKPSEEDNCIYDYGDKERIRDIILNFTNKESKVVLLESPYCIMLKKLLEKGIKDIQIPNHIEEKDFPEEYKKYVFPFSLGTFLGNFEFDRKIDVVWADFCGNWNTCREQIIPLFHRELLSDNSLLAISCSFRSTGKNDLLKDVLNYLENVTEYSGYNISILNETSFSGHGMYTIFIKINYANKPRCPKCFSSKVIKRGNRYAKFDLKQRFECKMCEYRFIIDANRLRIPENVRKFVFNKLKEGEKSTREISKEIENKFGIKISHVAIVRMFRDSRRYFGKDAKKSKKKVKKRLKAFSRKINGKNVQHPETKFEREILVIK